MNDYSATNYPYTLVCLTDELGGAYDKRPVSFHRTITAAKRAATLRHAATAEIRDEIADETIAIGGSRGWHDPRK